MTIKELVEQSHSIAKEKGWWDNDRNIGELFMLMVTEISEAMEEYRSGISINSTYYSQKELNSPLKPEGIPSELADVLIRIGDFCGKFNIDLEKILEEKIAYNKTREYRHGNKIA